MTETISHLPSSGDPLLDKKLSLLGSYFSRKNLVEIMAVRPGEIILEIAGKGFIHEKNPELTYGYWHTVMQFLANRRGYTFDDVKQPRVSTILPGYHRFEGMLGNVLEEYVSIAIRVFRQLDLEFEDFGMDPKTSDWLRDSVAKGCNLLIVGGTSSGKTSFMNTYIKSIPLEKRIFSVSDTPELRTDNDNRVSIILSRNEKDALFTYADAIDHILRANPSTILLSEISTANSYPCLRLLNTGHKGFATTLHSDSAEEAVRSTFYKNIMLAGHNIEQGFVEKFLRENLDIIVELRQIGLKKGRVTRVVSFTENIDVNYTYEGDAH